MMERIDNTTPLTWLDPQTGLEWQRESPGTMEWHEAMNYADSLSLHGKKDWRLPSIMELETLLDRSTLFERMRPGLRQDLPFQDCCSYWSSTTFGHNTQNAWIIMFDGGYILSYNKRNFYHVRSVRGKFSL
jgi:hypothetical protein